MALLHAAYNKLINNFSNLFILYRAVTLARSITSVNCVVCDYTN